VGVGAGIGIALNTAIFFAAQTAFRWTPRDPDHLRIGSPHWSWSRAWSRWRTGGRKAGRIRGRRTIRPEARIRPPLSVS